MMIAAPRRMRLDLTLWIAHALATLALTGLVWFVQLVHYPLLRRVGAAGFAEYEREHRERTSWLVVPAMGIESTTAVWLLARHRADAAAPLLIVEIGRAHV